MSVLRNKRICMGTATILLLMAILSPCIETFSAKDPIPEIMLEDRVLLSGSRSDLLLIENEELYLSGNHEFTRVILSSGSSLILEDCYLTLQGDGTQIPSVTGNPALLSMINSTIYMRSWDGSSLLMNRGGDSVIDIDVTDELHIERSTIKMQGGNSWFKGSPGAYFDTPLTDDEFSGGNCSMKITGSEGTKIEITDSVIELWGGNASKAPSGESMTHDDFFRSGGYSTGANVSGWVGSGGGTSVILDCHGSEITIYRSRITGIGGNGGNAGNGGGIIWNGSQTYTHPTTSGGYSSGGWKDGQPYDPGTVRGYVGCGGYSSIDINCSELYMEGSILGGAGGSPGEPGKGGSCISLPGGSPTTVTNTLGGGGGAGFSGGYGGYESLNQIDGGDGGDVLGNVGSAGDVNINIRCSSALWFRSNGLVSSGGMGMSHDYAGNGGGSVEYGLDGGGGGGGGWSGGGGAPAIRLYNGMNGGGKGITNDGKLSNGGSIHYTIDAEMFMSNSRTYITMNTGLVIIPTPVRGRSGEVGGSSVYAGGPGGAGNGQGWWHGTSSIDSPLPAPFPVHPLEGVTITDLSEPFEWSGPDTGFLSGTGLPLTFRLLGSSDVNDVIQEIECTGTSTHLEEAIEDDSYYWTVRFRDGDRNSSWMYPQRFMLDRVPPVLISGPQNKWYPLSEPVPFVRFGDEVSGIDITSAEFRAGRDDGNFSRWNPAIVIDNGNKTFDIGSRLPSIEGNWTFWARASDLAGNGPTLAGPYTIGIDGTGPDISHLDPGGWKGSSFHLEFSSCDNMSGSSDLFWLEIENGEDTDNISFDPQHLGGQRYRTREHIELQQGAYTLKVGNMDMVGNVGRSGPLSIQIDPAAPVLDAFSPADGAAVNDPHMVPTFHISDLLSGIEEVFYHLRGVDLDIEMTLDDIEGEMEVHLQEPLKEGSYSWTINARDVTGNTAAFGPFYFMVDLSDPEPSITRMENGSLYIYYHDNMTECSDLEVMCSVPGPTEMVMIWSEMIDHENPEPGETVVFDLGKEVPGPVSYLRTRATDISGNTGPWSASFRVDDGTVNQRIGIDVDEAVRSGEIVSLNITSPVGIDIMSAVVRISDGNDGYISTEIIDRSIIYNGTIFEASDLTVPKKVKIDVNVPFERGTFEPVVSFRDPLPDPITWVVRGKSFVMDPFPPFIEIQIMDFYREDVVSIPIEIGDDDTGISSVLISLDNGPYLPPNSPGSPSVEIDDGIMWISFNLTYGRGTEVSILVTDLAGNQVTGEFLLVATREPEVMIVREDESEVRAGDRVVLFAECRDPDGDELNITWLVNGEFAGSGDVLEIRPVEGTHIIELNCTDGYLFSSDSMIMEVLPPEQLPEGGSLSLILIISILAVIIVSGICSVIIIAARRRNDDEEMDWDDDGDEKVQIVSRSSRSAEGSRRCDICLRGMGDPGRIIKCRCGARFHRGCASSEGECPECGREIMIKV